MLAHKYELQVNSYYIGVIMQAYKTGKSLDTHQAFWEARAAPATRYALSPRPGIVCDGKGLFAFFEYVAAQKTNPHTYLDYLKACNYLGLDMSLPKNRFPHDFRYWHDIRIDQYATAQAEADRKAKRELYEKFAVTPRNICRSNTNKRSAFICITPAPPPHLVREGEILGHCVGRMNYDLAFCPRRIAHLLRPYKEQPDTPLVTLEYSLRNHKVLQCYGEHDHKPSEDILHYVNKVWLPYANRHLKQIQNAA